MVSPTLSFFFGTRLWWIAVGICLDVGTSNGGGINQLVEVDLRLDQLDGADDLQGIL